MYKEQRTSTGIRVMFDRDMFRIFPVLQTQTSKLVALTFIPFSNTIFQFWCLLTPTSEPIRLVGIRAWSGIWCSSKFWKGSRWFGNFVIIRFCLPVQSFRFKIASHFNIAQSIWTQNFWNIPFISTIYYSIWLKWYCGEIPNPPERFRITPNWKLEEQRKREKNIDSGIF